MNEREESPEEQMQAMIAEIERVCKETDQLWTDPEFRADDSSLYIDPLQPPEYAQHAMVEWKRPHEIYTQDEPKLIKDNTKPGDVKQGELGDCWLLGSFLCLATNDKLLQNLFFRDGIQYGYAVFQFFKNGKWQFVIVDTRIPYNPTTKGPLYGHCSDPQEFWVPLMEKAYAKLHSSYEILNGGSMAHGLVDLTGGVSYKFNLTVAEQKAAIESGAFWKDMKKWCQ